MRFSGLSRKLICSFKIKDIDVIIMRLSSSVSFALLSRLEGWGGGTRVDAGANGPTARGLGKRLNEPSELFLLRSLAGGPRSHKHAVRSRPTARKDRPCLGISERSQVAFATMMRLLSVLNRDKFMLP